MRAAICIGRNVAYFKHMMIYCTRVYDDKSDDKKRLRFAARQAHKTVIFAHLQPWRMPKPVGVTASWLRSWLDGTVSLMANNESMSTADVCMAVVKPACKSKQCAFADLVSTAAIFTVDGPLC
jgi:hypothetical protein